MRKPKSRQDQIDWERRVDKETGFFGLIDRHAGDTTQEWEARQAALAHMGPWIQNAENLGADGDFLRACTLCLAELAVKDDTSSESYVVSKGSPKIILSERRRGLALVREIRERARKMHQDEWPQAAGRVEPADPTPPPEEKVNRTFSDLLAALDEYIEYHTSAGRAKGSGRPPHELILVVLSGMDRHLERETGEAQRSLLSKLVSGLRPSLPIATGRDQLRSAIYDYRKRKAKNRDEDLKELKREYDFMRKKLLAVSGIPNA